jgi:hypothetical protein
LTRFGSAIVLEGFGLPHARDVQRNSPVVVSTRAGDTLDIDLCWSTRARPDASYTVFLHLLDPAGNILAQQDGEPRSGNYPTSVWDAGEFVSDERSVALPEVLRPGEYRLVAGLYELTSGERLRAEGSTETPDAVELLTVRVLE